MAARNSPCCCRAPPSPTPLRWPRRSAPRCRAGPTTTRARRCPAASRASFRPRAWTGRCWSPPPTRPSTPQKPAAATSRWSRACRSCRWWREGFVPSLRAKRSNPDCLREDSLDCFVASLLAMTSGALLPQILLHFRNEPVTQLRPLQAVGDVGAEEAGLGAAIMALALELDAVEALRSGEADHGIGELDLSAGAALLGLQDLEDLRLQDVAAGDREVGGRGALGRLLDHAVDLEHLAGAFADAADAVLMGQMVRHRLDRDDVGFFAELAGGVDHLLQAAGRIEHEFVGQHDRERFVADDVARAPDRVTEAERRLLAGEGDGAGLPLGLRPKVPPRLVLRQNVLLGLLAARGQRRIELEHPVEMIFDDTFVAAGDKDEVLDAGFPGLVIDVLDQRLVDDRQHFLRHRLGGGQDAGAEAGNGKYGFADLHGIDRIPEEHVKGAMASC